MVIIIIIIITIMIILLRREASRGLEEQFFTMRESDLKNGLFSNVSFSFQNDWCFSKYINNPLTILIKSFTHEWY